MKRQALRAEDGAQFRGGVTQVEPNLFRAHCYAQMDSGSHIDTEMPDYEMRNSHDAGIAWIKQRAAVRGFNRVVID